MVFHYIILILCVMSLGLKTQDIFLVAFHVYFDKSMYFEEKIEAPLTPALAPGASIGKNTVVTLRVDLI